MVAGLDWSELCGSRLAGRYDLSHLLRATGSNAVYRAMAAGEATPLAVKLVPTRLAGRAGLARWTREARLAASVRDAHVLETLDAGRDDELGVLYLVTPLCTGGDLESLLGVSGPLSAEHSVRIALDVCAGLTAIHGASIVHRDVKPANVLLRFEPAGDVSAVLADLGIAKGLFGEDELTATNGFIGSLAYVSPEQAASAKHVDERTDLFSLGVTLYRMLSGRLPFEPAEHYGSVLRAIEACEVRPLADVAPWLDERLVRAIHRALARQPEDRFSSARTMADALRACVDVPKKLYLEDLRSPPPAEAAPSPRRDPVLGEQIGSCQIERRIGGSGGAVVYEASTQDGRRLALKVFAAGDAVETPMLERWRSLEHPNVTKLHEYGRTTSGAQFTATELLSGGDLAALYRRAAPLRPRPLAGLFADVAGALAAAHAKELVHGQVSARNLLLHARAGDRLTLKIVDFTTRPGRTMAGDVRDLCAVLYEGLAGSAPSPRSPEPLKKRAPWVDDTLASIVDRALAGDARYRSMEALASELERSLAREAPREGVEREELRSIAPVEWEPIATPSSSVAPRPARRRALALAAVAAVVAAVAVSFSLRADSAYVEARSGGLLEAAATTRADDRTTIPTTTPSHSRSTAAERLTEPSAPLPSAELAAGPSSAGPRASNETAKASTHAAPAPKETAPKLPSAATTTSARPPQPAKPPAVVAEDPLRPPPTWD